MKPLKILQIVPSISLVYGGPSQMVRGLSAALGAQSAVGQVTVITTDSNGDVDELPLDVPLGQPVTEDGYEVIYFRCSPFRRYKFSLDLLSWLWANADQYDIAHIHALFSPVSTSAATVCRWKNLPYLMRPLGTLDPADLQKKKQTKQLYASLFERPNLAGAAAIHFTSEQEAKVSERFGVETPDVVIPLGVALPDLPERIAAQASIRAAFDIPAERTIVLFMSRVDPKKGFDLLLPALEDLYAHDCPFHFLLCGANPQDRAYENDIRRQIQAAPWADQATLNGFVSGELKAQILSAADVFVLPSYYENFGIAVAEAMAASIPVVISDQVHIWPEIQASTAGWVVPCEVKALTEALETAIAQPDERLQRGQNARRCAQEKYSWEAIAQRITITYQQILDAKP
ncbi:hormogonium polysaccharide biosynthesis glycosyltransferase HpsP [Leptolyngbya sp. BC1307]|uniref:hormogonium polysaccharide biosynthesis glycosyltransferase HpsP n=1 Tax=Leptolyngbya sp. BC1307 TaxID=2029589 RepID=UPI000EFAF319|nr:hormogonium polysaccharide biosynthesis glycosyltransferase HpsP [Leptolyngbya sp. BC1307]